MKANDLREDKFLINLCDDISIVYHSIGTQLGMMYTTARQTSQGRQHTYTSTPTSKKNREDDLNDDCNKFDDQLLNIKLTPSKLIRSHAVGRIDIPINDTTAFLPPSLIRHYTDNPKTSEYQMFNSLKDDSQQLDDCDIDKYRISNITTSCYATPSSLNTMTQVSQF
jgi:hypothetical protein